MKSYVCVVTAAVLAVGWAPMNEWSNPIHAQALEEAHVVSFGTSLKNIPFTSEVSRVQVVSSKPLRLPVYKPPKGIGAPGGRVGGGTRGGDSTLAMLFALVPDHLGLTIQEQPSLYWYLSNSTPYKLVLTINRTDLIKPVLEVTLTDKAKRGIQFVSLEDHDIKLERDREYAWFVSLILDEEHHGKNIVAGGRIKRIVPPEKLLVQLREAEPQEVTSVYSEAGLWYDAFDSISDLIEGTPQNSEYSKGRKYLLKQVALDDIMEIAKEEDSVYLMDSSYLQEEHLDYQDESYVRALVEHRIGE